MRNNQPVTNVEVLLDDKSLIVSKTDLKGLITFVNKDFIDISGFTEAELIGQPHNIVRHPDMPVEAYADLWQDLKDGRPWTGVVKNRCKNGDFYWVLATATPIRENGQVVGYMSVRRKPTRQLVEASENAYRLFRESRAGSLRIRHGAAVTGSEGLFARMSLKAKLVAGFGTLLLALALVTGLGLWGMEKTHESVDKLYSEGLQPTQALASIGKLMADNRAQILLALQHDPNGAYVKLHDHPLDMHLKQIDSNIAEISGHWESYKASITSEDQQKLADDYLESRKLYVADGLLLAKAALQEGRFDDANLILLKKINPLYNESAGKAEALFKMQIVQGGLLLAESDARFHSERMWIVLILALALVGGVFIALGILRSITRPIESIIATFQSLANGDFTSNLELARNDEIGKVLQGLQSMQIQQGFNVAEARRIGDEMTRIKIALDNVSTGVVISDNGRDIIYVNKSAQSILKTAEEDFRRVLPNFSADHLVGTNIDTFHKDPSHQAKLLAQFTSTYVANLKIGGRSMTVTANPVFSINGERLGSVAEWLDRTAEVAVEDEVAGIVTAAANGDFTQRLALEGKSGFFLELATGMNLLLETASAGLTSVAEVLNSLAQGDLTQTMEGSYGGTFGQLKDDANATVGRLREVVGQIAEATDAINTAAKEIASGNQDLSSRTEEQASSLEETASSMEELTATVKQNAENARQANELAAGAQSVAEKGGEVVGQVVHTMSSIHQASSKIADIIGVIDGIAFQTNILALNAAVEAARAGEQGRGFAVVATEVRNLAKRSADAAREIKGLISDSVDRVEAGNRLVDQAGRTMEEVVSSIKRVAKIVTDISEASREQSAGIEQVSLAVSQMDEVTQQNAALVEEAAAAAESLEDQAHQLSASVSVFKVSAHGIKTPRLSPPAEPKAASAAPRQSASRKPEALPESLDDEWSEF